MKPPARLGPPPPTPRTASAPSANASIEFFNTVGGDLTPTEAADPARVLEGYGKALELNEIESRRQELEPRLDRQGGRRSGSDE